MDKRANQEGDHEDYGHEERGHDVRKRETSGEQELKKKKRVGDKPLDVSDILEQPLQLALVYELRLHIDITYPDLASAKAAELSFDWCSAEV